MSVRTREAPSAAALTLNLVALLALAGISLALRYAHLGALGFFAALAIAVVKMLLVAVVFMELVREKPTVRIAVATGFALFALLMALVIADVLTRAISPLGNPPGTAERARG
jgi:caa(3)-type oxidase subunit IV